MSQYVTNKTDTPVHPEIIKADSTKTSVCVMPRPGRVRLEAGATVSADWIARNPNTIVIFDAE